MTSRLDDFHRRAMSAERGDDEWDEAERGYCARVLLVAHDERGDCIEDERKQLAVAVMSVDGAHERLQAS